MATTSLPGVGLLKGLGVTLKHLFKTPATSLYPHVQPDLPPRTRGVIALMDENCTVCMLCARECPDWCIYIDSHKESVPAAKEGGRARTRNVLDRFAIDFALCMYCGICVEVCPFDALFWSPEFEYAEYDMSRLLHEKGKLREWMDTVPPPPGLDAGAAIPGEVSDAIAKAEKELEQAAQQAEEAKQQSEQAKAGGDAPAAGKAKADEPKVEAGEIDQETYDALIAEGKSERIARSKAKAAHVKKQKARIREQQASEDAADAEAPEAAAPAPAAAEVKVEAGQIDQETYDALIAEGKPERMARAKAKAAWVKKEKARLRDEAAASAGDQEEAAASAGDQEEAAAGGDAAEVDTPAAEPVDRTGEPEDAAGPAAEAPQPGETPAPTEAGAAADAPEGSVEPAEAPATPQKKLGDVHVEGAGEIDQETYDALIAEGKSERIARSKAKAAWIKKKKQEQLDAEGEE